MSQTLADLSNFPDACKIAEIIPLHKKGSSLDCKNYGAISLLSNIRKITETLLHKRLYSFLEQSECLCNLQFGFRPLHSKKTCTDYYNGTN